MVFGAGIVGRSVLASLAKNGVNVKYVIDNNSQLWGKKIGSAKIISLEVARKLHRSDQIIVASVIYEREIVEQLKRYKFTKILPMSYLNYLYPNIFDFRDYQAKYTSLFQTNAKAKIKQLYSYLKEPESKRILNKIIGYRLKNYCSVKMDEITTTKPQYFDQDVIKLSRNEVFVDGGAYDGDTIGVIVKKKSWENWKIIAFEPDYKNFASLKKFVTKSRKKRTEIVRSGLWKQTDQLSFFGLGTPESGIGDEKKFDSWSGTIKKTSKIAKVEKLSVVSIDEYFWDKEVPTYIKMDIEGAEKEALMGAKKIIKKYKPKLAICIYHKPSDLWEIPLLIKKLNPDYQLYIRHYSREVCETVCYAV